MCGWLKLFLKCAVGKIFKPIGVGLSVGKIRSVCVKLQRNCLPFFGCLLEVWLVFLRLLVTVCGLAKVADLKAESFSLVLSFIRNPKLDLSTEPAILPNCCYAFGFLNAIINLKLHKK